MSVTLECPTCALVVPEGLAYCPRCRAKAEGRTYDPAEVDRHERQYVLSLVALSVGLLGVPRAWRSPAFSTPAKVAITVLGVANTTAAFALGAWFLGAYVPGILAQLQRAR